MPTMLVTGFGAFGPVVSNPTERLAARATALAPEGWRVTGALLPVSWRRTPVELHALLDAGVDGRPFDTVLLCGVAANSPCWRVEQYAHNVTKEVEDADGATPPAPHLVEGGADRLDSTANTERISAAIGAAYLPSSLTESAGAYLCNAAYYHALHWLLGRGLDTPCVFLHVPAAPDSCVEPPPTVWDHEEHEAALAAAMAALATTAGTLSGRAA